MAYIPIIKGYKPFYIQTDSDQIAVDTTAFGLVAKVNPYPVLPNPKELYSNDWKDESGADEYVSNIVYQPIEFSVKFYVKCFATNSKSASQVMREQIDALFAKIKSGEFKTFDSYNCIGFQKVRYASYEEESFTSRTAKGNDRTKDWACSIFSIGFKANDPVTRMKLSTGKIIADV